MASARAASLLADALRAVSMDAVLDRAAERRADSRARNRTGRDAELRESDSHGFGAPPSAAQAHGPPLGESRARAPSDGSSASPGLLHAVRLGKRRRNAPTAPGATLVGVFSQTRAQVSRPCTRLACLDPVDRARVTVSPADLRGVVRRRTTRPVPPRSRRAFSSPSHAAADVEGVVAHTSVVGERPRARASPRRRRAAAARANTSGAAYSDVPRARRRDARRLGDAAERRLPGGLRRGRDGETEIGEFEGS